MYTLILRHHQTAQWALENAHITMHLSGRSRTHEIPLTAKRFLENLHRYCEGKPLLYQVDLKLGY